MPKRHFLWHFVENRPPKKCCFGTFYDSGDDRVKESTTCVSEFAGSTIHAKIDRLKQNLDQSKLHTCYKGNTHHSNTYPSIKKKHKGNPFSTPKRNLMRNQPLKSYIPNIHSYYYHRDVMRQICHKKPSHTQYNFQKLMNKFHIHNRYFNTYKQSIIGYFMRNIRCMHKNDTITTLWVICQLRSKNQFMTKHKSISRHTSNKVQHQNNSKVHNQLRGRNQTKGNVRTHHTQVAGETQTRKRPDYC